MALQYDPETGTWYDDGQGYEESVAAPPTSPAPGTPPEPARDRAAEVREHVRSEYRRLTGRDPDENELASGAANYERYGGDQLRAEIGSRFAPSPVVATGGVASGARQFAAPSFDRPSLRLPEPLAHEPFVAPTADTFTADPGYAFTLTEGQRAIRNALAPTGVAKSPTAIMELGNWTMGRAAQEFDNVYNRQLRTYGVNEQGRRASHESAFRNALTDYTTNYGAEMDEFDRAARSFAVNQGASQDYFGNLLSLYGLATRSLPSYQPLPSLTF